MSLFNPYSYQRLMDLREEHLTQKMKRRQQLHMDRAESSVMASPPAAASKPNYRPSERPAGASRLAGRSISSREM